MLTQTSQSYSNHPGPKYYYSHFSSLQFASALAFDALQALRLVYQPCEQELRLRTRLARYLTIGYWIILSASGFTCAISYSLTPKPDATAIQALIFVHSAVVLLKMVIDWISPNTLYSKAASNYEPKPRPRLSRYLFAFCRNFNRVLKFIRLALSVLFIVGSVQLARQYRFRNP